MAICLGRVGSVPKLGKEAEDLPQQGIVREGSRRNSLDIRILLYSFDIFVDVFARLPYIKGRFSM